VKCNPDPVLVAYLQSLGCDFDCATASEMDLVVNKLSHPAERVIFSNPCKLSSHIRYAKSVGVVVTIIDNMDEIIKVKTIYPEAKVLIRLACSDLSARSPMSLKFGATRDQVRPLLEYAAKIGLECIGTHFHVGSGCSDPSSFSKALVDARRAFDIGSEYGHNMYLVDLGGGYPSLDVEKMTCQAESTGVYFEEMALVINTLLEQLFPNDPVDGKFPYKFVAEPGRFFAGGCASLVNKVHSKSVVGVGPDGRKQIRYYMTEGLYGTLSCVIFDQQDKLHPYLLKEIGISNDDDTASESTIATLNHDTFPTATMFGPTCDGFDKICDVASLPELNVGDRLIYLNFGAYTMSITTSFNGFESSKVFYYKVVD
jgi:diaminopimelate decarboxylase